MDQWAPLIPGDSPHLARVPSWPRAPLSSPEGSHPWQHPLPPYVSLLSSLCLSHSAIDLMWRFPRGAQTAGALVMSSPPFRCLSVCSTAGSGLQVCLPPYRLIPFHFSSSKWAVCTARSWGRAAIPGCDSTDLIVAKVIQKPVWVVLNLLQGQGEFSVLYWAGAQVVKYRFLI